VESQQKKSEGPACYYNVSVRLPPGRTSRRTIGETLDRRGGKCPKNREPPPPPGKEEASTKVSPKKLAKSSSDGGLGAEQNRGDKDNCPWFSLFDKLATSQSYSCTAPLLLQPVLALTVNQKLVTSNVRTTRDDAPYKKRAHQQSIHPNPFTEKRKMKKKKKGSAGGLTPCSPSITFPFYFYFFLGDKFGEEERRVYRPSSHSFSGTRDKSHTGE
jgi:hypothetical protein